MKIIALTLFSVLLVSLNSMSSSFTTEKRQKSLAQVEEGTLNLENGLSLHYLAKGLQGQKPLLLFIHGAPERADTWEDYMKYFSHDYFTVAYTTRGIYPSTTLGDIEGYNTNQLAADALLVAQSFGYEKFTIVGHDWGATTAWRAAINYPDAVERLVVFNNPHPVMYARAYNESEVHRNLIDAYIPLARNDIAPWSREGTLANDLDHFKNYVYQDNVKNKISWSLGQKFEQTWEHNNGSSIEEIYKHYKALDFPFIVISNCNPAPGISLTVEQPVLSFYGDLDRFVSPDAYHLPDNDCEQNTWLVRYPEGGHFIHHQYKYDTRQKMSDFFHLTQ